MYFKFVNCQSNNLFFMFRKVVAHTLKFIAIDADIRGIIFHKYR